jgi:signal transduction histidine kinase
MLEQEDLVGALRQRLEAVEHRSGLEASLLVERDVTVSDQAEAVLYGITQEALNNALKHAQARTVVVSLRCSDEGAAILEVVDDGCGFEPACVGDEGGMGLTSMRERAARMGGALVILSEPGGGTTVRVSLPEACRTAAEVGW